MAGMTAGERFAWAKHEGTAGMLDGPLLGLFQGEVAISGAEGARRFIDGLAGPA